MFENLKTKCKCRPSTRDDKYLSFRRNLAKSLSSSLYTYIFPIFFEYFVFYHFIEENCEELM